MPAAEQYISDFGSREYKALEQAARNEREQRNKLITRNKKYYDGQHHQHLKTGADGVDDNVTINLCRQAVDRTIDFLVPEMPVLELDENEDTEDERLLSNLWTMAGGVVLLKKLMRNGAIAGHGYVRVYEEANGQVGLLPLAPQNVITFWNADNVNDVLWHRLEWTIGKTDVRQDIIQEPMSWLIREFVKKGNQWQATDEFKWPFEIGPVIDYKHLPSEGYYGDHELQHAHLNDVFNSKASDFARILRFHAYPRTIGTGFEASKVQETGIDDFWVIDSKDAKVFNLEMQSDLMAAVRFLELIERNFFRQSRVVLMQGDPEAFKNITNLGINAVFMDMITKNETLRANYSKLIQTVSVLMMAMVGKMIDMPPNVHWGNALPVDTAAQVMEVERKIALGLMSKKTAAAALGIDYDAEVELMNKEAEAEGLRMEAAMTGASVGVS